MGYLGSALHSVTSTLIYEQDQGYKMSYKTRTGYLKKINNHKPRKSFFLQLRVFIFLRMCVDTRAYIHFIHTYMHVCILNFVLDKPWGSGCRSSPARGSPAARSSRARRRRYPHPFLRLRSRDKRPTCASLPADKASCEDAEPPPVFVAPHTFPVATFRWAPVSAVLPLPLPLPPPRSAFIGGNSGARRDGPRSQAD